MFQGLQKFFQPQGIGNGVIIEQSYIFGVYRFYGYIVGSRKTQIFRQGNSFNLGVIVLYEFERAIIRAIIDQNN